MFGVNVDGFSHDGIQKEETVAFGYRARALVFEQRVRRTFGYPRHAPFRLTAGDGLATPIPRRGFSFPV
jgi:hypothetical protein